MRRRKRIEAAIGSLQRHQEQIAQELAALRRQVDELRVPTPAEYNEQLLRTLRAGLARVEVTQSQLLDALGAAPLDASPEPGTDDRPVGPGEHRAGGE